MKHNAASARKMVLAAAIDPYELGVRIAEAFYGMRRPPGATGRQAFDGLEPEDQQAVLKAAEAAATYLKDCVNAGRAVQ